MYEWHECASNADKYDGSVFDICARNYSLSILYMHDVGEANAQGWDTSASMVISYHGDLSNVFKWHE